MQHNWRSDLLAREPNEPRRDQLDERAADQRVFLMAKSAYDAQQAEHWEAQAWWLKVEARMAEGVAVLLFVALVFMIWRPA